MPPKKSEYKNKMSLGLDKLKNGDIQKVKVDLSKLNIKNLAKRVGVLSEAVNMFMYLPSSDRHCALNDRTINLLMGGDIDMSVTVGQEAVRTTISDAEIVAITVEERNVELFIVDKNKTSWWVILSIS